MKRLLLLTTLALLIFGCRNRSDLDAAKTNTTKLAYPFKPAYSINWQPGDEKNALIVLNSLKKYASGDVKGAFDNYADSITFLATIFILKAKKTA